VNKTKEVQVLNDMNTCITRCKFTQKPRVANCVRVRRVYTHMRM